MHKYVLLSAAALAALVSAHSLAADLQEKTDRDIRYLSGGVGQAEAAAMREAAPSYNLDMLFATEKGAYMAGIQVHVKKANGETVLSAVSDGPMLLADLPPGRYTVEAKAEGKSFARDVNLAKGEQRQLVFRWPSPPDSGAARAGRGEP